MIQIEKNTILVNETQISCPAKIFSYVELKDRLIVLVLFKSEMYETDKDTLRNIFCYDKQTGEQLWQVEGCGDSVYVGMGIRIKQEDGSYIPGGIRAGEWGQVMSVTYLNKELRKGLDYIQVRTFACHEYALDIDTGKVTFLRQGK